MTETAFDSLWNYDEPAETEAKFRGLLPEAQASKDRSFEGQLLTQIARTLGLQRKFEEAHEVLNQVEEDLSEPLVQSRYLLERGRVYRSSGEPEKAKPFFREAMEVASDAGFDFYAVDAAHMRALTESGDSALVWNEKAVAMAETAQEERAKKWLGSLYNNIGWTYFDKADYSTALNWFEKTRAHFQERDLADRLRIAEWSIAKMYRHLGRLDEALSIQHRLLEEAGDDPSGYTYEELGECYLAKGEKDKAKPYFASAYRHLSEDVWLQANESDRLQRLKVEGGLDE